LKLVFLSTLKWKVINSIVIAQHFHGLQLLKIIHFLLPIEEKNPLASRPLHIFVPNFFCIILLDVVLIYFNISWWSYKLNESQIKIKVFFFPQNDSFYVYEWASKFCHNKTFRHLFNPSKNYFLFFWTSWNSWHINVFYVYINIT
jgi:hypothetical protein